MAGVRVGKEGKKKQGRERGEGKRTRETKLLNTLFSRAQVYAEGVALLIHSKGF